MYNFKGGCKNRIMSYKTIKQKVNNEVLDLIKKSAMVYDVALKNYYGPVARNVYTAVFLASLKTDSIARRYLNELGINFEDVVETFDSLELTEKISSLDFTNLLDEERIEQIYNEDMRYSFESLLELEDIELIELSEKKNYNLGKYMNFVGIEHIIYNLLDWIGPILSAMEERFVARNSLELQDNIEEDDKSEVKSFIKKIFTFNKNLKNENINKKNIKPTKKYRRGECSFNSFKTRDLLRFIELYRLRLKDNDQTVIREDLQKIIENACEKYYNIKDKDVYVYRDYSESDKRKLMEAEKRVACLLISCLEDEGIIRELEKEGIDTFPIKRYFSDIKGKKVENNLEEKTRTQEDIRRDFDMILRDFISISQKRQKEGDEEVEPLDLLEYILFSHIFGIGIGFDCIFNIDNKENGISSNISQFINNRKDQRHTKKMYDYLCNNEITGVYHEFEELPGVDEEITTVCKWYANQNIDGKQIKNLILEKRQMISYYPGHKAKPLYIWHLQNIPFDKKAQMLKCILNGNTGVYLNDAYELIQQLQKDDYDPRMEILINFCYKRLEELGVFIDIDTQTDIMRDRHINNEAYIEYMKHFSEHVQTEGLEETLQTMAALDSLSSNFIINEDGQMKKTYNGINPKSIKGKENSDGDRAEL